MGWEYWIGQREPRAQILRHERDSALHDLEEMGFPAELRSDGRIKMEPRKAETAPAGANALAILAALRTLSGKRYFLRELAHSPGYSEAADTSAGHSQEREHGVDQNR